MKKLILLSFSILIVIALFFPCCAKPTEVIELRLAHYEPPVSSTMRAYQEYADKIEEATNGQVKITLYGSSSLLGQQDMVSGVKSGIAEMGHISLDSYTDQYPLNPILSLPLLPVGDWQTCYDVWMELLDEYPEMEDEWSDFKVLFRTTRDGMQVHTIEGEVRTPADIKGKKLFAPGEIAKGFDALGASAMFIAPPDWYTSLERGLMEGMVTTWDAVYEMGLAEFLKYHTSFPSYAAHPMAQVIMNQQTWDSLPNNVKKAFNDLEPWISERVGELIQETVDGFVQEMEQEGSHHFIMLTTAEEQAWVDGARPAHNEYLNKLESQGLPARAIYEEAIKLAAQ